MHRRKENGACQGVRGGEKKGYESQCTKFQLCKVGKRYLLYRLVPVVNTVLYT